MSAVSTTLVLLAVVCLLIMALLLSAADRSVHEVRSSIFPIVREEGATRARRARLGATVAAVLSAIAAVAFVANGQPILQGVLPSVPVAPLLAQLTRTEAPEAEPTVAPTPEPTPSPTQVADLATSTALPVEPSPTAAPSATPSVTPLPPTDTPQPPSPTRPAATASAVTSSTSVATTATMPGPTAVPSPVAEGTLAPAPPGVRMGPIAFSEEIDTRRLPVSPSSVFSETVKRVYAVFPFSGMQKGSSWTQVWSINGEEFARERADWQWGEQDHSYIFVKPVGAGEYRLDLYVSNQLLATGKFTVLGPAAIGGPLSP